MARQTPTTRFRLDTESIDEYRAASASPNMSSSSSPNSNHQRSQTRIRRSACSDLQNSTIPEERIYHDNRRRASLFVGRPQLQPLIKLRKNSTDKPQTSEGDYIKLCRQRCQSLYKSLANKTSKTTPNEDEQQQEEEDDDDEINFQPPPSSRRNYRYSLPDASPAALALRNILKRNKTTKHNHVRIDLPSNSSHSFSSSTSTSSSSPISTFRNFLSLVKIPSTKPSILSAHHSSLTALSNAIGGSSTTLDQTHISMIPPTMQWHFEVKLGLR